MRQNGTTGKSPKPVQCSRQKYFAFFVGQINGLTPAVSADERGVAHVTNARWDAVDARAATDVDVCGSSVRRSRVVLTPRCWRQVREGQASRGRRWQKSRSPGRARSKP